MAEFSFEEAQKPAKAAASSSFSFEEASRKEAPAQSVWQRLAAPITDIPSEIGRAAGESLQTMHEAVPESLGGTRRPEKETFFQGLKRTGASLLAVPELLGSPITGAARSLIGHPMAEAVHGAGSVIAPAKAKKETPEQVYEAVKPGVDLAMTAIGARGTPGGIARARTAVPTIEEIHQEASAGYATAGAYGVELHPTPVARLADDISAQLRAANFRDFRQPETFRAIQELAVPLTEGRSARLGDFEGVRGVLGEIARDNVASRPSEAAAAHRAIDFLDDFLENLTPQHVASNAQNLQAMLTELQNARGNWRAFRAAEAFGEKVDRAARQAAASGTGANVENTIRQQFKQILNSRKERAKYTPDQVELMERIVRGTYTGNIARALGKLAPHGPVTLMSSLASAAYLGPHGLAVPIIGEAGKLIGERMTARNVRRLDELTRATSPLGVQQTTASAPAYSPTAAALGLGPLYARELASPDRQ